jgi:hypothetical protein
LRHSFYQQLLVVNVNACTWRHSQFQLAQQKPVLMCINSLWCAQVSAQPASDAVQAQLAQLAASSTPARIELLLLLPLCYNHIVTVHPCICA